jgi:hypothetical protein
MQLEIKGTNAPTGTKSRANMLDLFLTNFFNEVKFRDKPLISAETTATPSRKSK